MPPKASSPKPMSSQQLLAELQQDNMFFDQLVDMIPTKLYIAGQSGDDYNPKYFKGQSKQSKEARRAKNKQSKQAKFDPSTAETTTQVKQRLEQESLGKRKHASQMPGVPRIPPTAALGKSGSKANAPNSNNNNKNNNNQSRIEALREKLHAKLAEKRGLRPNKDPSAVSKRAARKLEKQKRKEEAIAANKRKKKATSNAEDKSKSKKFKLSTELTDKGATVDLAQVDFGRLAGLNPTNNSNYTETNKALRNLSKTKNLEKMLADAEAKKQRLEELKQSNAEEDKQKAANMEWGDAIKEASGERVKDDPAKLKKALKRKVAKKQKSAKAWQTRMEQTQQKMDERQKIRNHNLNKRKMGGTAGANLSKKRIATDENTADGKKEPGRRLSRPGFEGRKQDFLNKKSSAKQQ